MDFGDFFEFFLGFDNESSLGLGFFGGGPGRAELFQGCVEFFGLDVSLFVGSEGFLADEEGSMGSLE
jgi:hypothetical protein